ncbi:hypothetical protein UFOVP1437_56 [uncultured Caudovirales phage]|uniref:Uncharacterized protein n=1 Tax=uncultured Caudovirales phage TaxID=2100421 RepID=A0A6J7XJN2_9CAUD|nr:hypothetical protein UFOVP1437_56 [uncultured Caudovirales phage]CAB5228115.1 hypothetical protein UFOVP1531_9 [uncultured Caudovirales phage]
MRQWEEDPVTMALIKALHARLDDLYQSLVKIQLQDNYDLKIAENRGRILELQTISDMSKLKELLNEHINWEQ